MISNTPLLLLAALLLAQPLLGALASRGASGTIAEMKQRFGAPSSCSDLKDPKACDEDKDCTWCLGKGDIGTSCYAVHMARQLPKRFFSCDNDPRSVTATAATTATHVEGVSECVGVDTSDKCDALNSCTWCVGQGNVGTDCYPVAMARMLPKKYFMCDNDSRSLSKAAEQEEQEEEEEDQKEEQKEQDEDEEEEEHEGQLGGVSECVGVKDSATCNGKDGCTWCMGLGDSGTACYPVGAARLLPKRFFTCDNDSRN